MLVIHVIATMILAAANVGALVMTLLARRSHAPVRILGLLRIHHVFAANILVPAAATTLLTGAVLVYQSGVSLMQPWMVGTLVLFVASALIGVLWLLPEEARAIVEAARQVDAREPAPSARLVRHTAAPAVVIAEWGAQVTMVAMFVLMSVRPA